MFWEKNEGIRSIGRKMRVYEVLEENEGIRSTGRKMRVSSKKRAGYQPMLKHRRAIT